MSVCLSLHAGVRQFSEMTGEIRSTALQISVNYRGKCRARVSESLPGA